MTYPQHIVCGTDFSDNSKGSVREALRLASLEHSRQVTVIHVTQRAPSSPDELHTKIRTWVETLEEATHVDSARIHTDVVQGTIAEGIAEAAARCDAELIVVGPLRHGFVQKVFSGGVAEQLFELVNIPVLATRSPVLSGYTKLLVCVDFSPKSINIVQCAAQLARLSDPHGEIHLLHAFTLPGGVHALAARQNMEQTYRNALERDLKSLASQANASDIVQSTRVAYGISRDVVLEEAKSLNASIVCMGSGGEGKSLSRRLLGSTISSVIQEIDRPLLVV